MTPKFHIQRLYSWNTSWGTILLTGCLNFVAVPDLAKLLQEFSQPVFSHNSTFLSQEATTRSVVQVARQVTVRILTNPGAGSGVLISREGQTYTVLTCDHVANSSSEQTYQVLTADGKIHLGVRQNLPDFPGIDLALIRFESQNHYSVATLGNLEQISIGDPIYISGFPNYQPRDGNNLDITYDWGWRAFRFTEGNLAMRLSHHSLLRGYQLAYTNETSGGMSGRPVFNQQGELIGIHGRGQAVLQGIEAFQFTNGTFPSSELYEQMSQFSWAISISTFQQRLKSSSIPFPAFPEQPVYRNQSSEEI